MSNFSLTEQQQMGMRSTENLQEILNSRKIAIQRINNQISRGDNSNIAFKQDLLEDMALVQAVLANRQKGDQCPTPNKRHLIDAANRLKR